MSQALSVKLVGPKSDAVRLLRVHLERGRGLRSLEASSRQHVDELRQKKDAWVSDTVELLKRIFDQPTVAEGFSDTGGRFTSYPMDMPAAGDLLGEELDFRIARLSVVLKRVEQTADTTGMTAVREPAAIVSPPGFGPNGSASSVASGNGAAASATAGKSILVISHGVDPKHVDAASEFLGRLGLAATVQTREPGKIVELESTGSAAFAVLLLSAEDANQSRPGGTNTLRSDIAFDMGFLCGRVGSNRIAVLFPQGGESFSCTRQIPYIPIDSAGGWMLHLARQMKKASVDIDLNRVL